MKGMGRGAVAGGAAVLFAAKFLSSKFFAKGVLKRSIHKTAPFKKQLVDEAKDEAVEKLEEAPNSEQVEE
jgi:hypothetical protein